MFLTTSVKNPLIFIQRFCADSISLNTIANVLSLEQELRDFFVRKRTVAKADSIGFVVQI